MLGERSHGYVGRVLADWRATGAIWASPTLRHNSFMSDSSFGSFTSRLDPAVPCCSSGSGFSAPTSSRSFPCPRLRDGLEPRLWRILRTIALEYIAIAFTADFVTLHRHELGKHPLSYLPFVLMLVSGAGLRFVAFWDRRLRPLRENLSLGVPGRAPLSQFGRMSREDHLVVWPVLMFVVTIVVLLALDDALWMTFDSALALYGPLVAVLSGYVLFKSVVRGVRLIGNQFT